MDNNPIPHFNNIIDSLLVEQKYLEDNFALTHQFAKSEIISAVLKRQYQCEIRLTFPDQTLVEELTKIGFRVEVASFWNQTLYTIFWR